MISSIKLNYVYSLLNKALIAFSHFIYIPYIARVLGPEKIGIQSYTYSVVFVFVVLATFGIFTLGQREIARCRDDRKEYSKVFWNIYLSSVTIIASFLIIWFLFITLVDGYKIFYIILTISLLATFFDITWFYIGFEQFKKILIRNAVIKLITLSFIFTFIKSENDLYLYVLIISVSELVGNLSLWYKFKGSIDRLNLSEITPKKYIKLSLNYYIPSICLSIYIIVDKVMIGLMTDSKINSGLYEQTANVILLVETLVATLSSVLYPRLSYLFSIGDFLKIKEKIKASLDYFSLMIFPSVIGISLVGDDFVLIFLGEKFIDVVNLIYLMCPIVFLVCLSNLICLIYTTPSGKISLTNKIVPLGIFINIVGNYFLIPKLGINGAIISSILAEFIVASLYLWVSKDYIKLAEIIRLSFKRIFAVTVMFLAIFLFKELFEEGAFRLIISIVLGALTYLLTLLMLKDKLCFYGLSMVINRLKFFKRFKKL